MKKNVTVVTPTYNREKFLRRLYTSILNVKGDFINEWIIIDDGSSDGTQQIVQEFKNDSKLKIRYYYKDNGGKYTAMIEAKKYIDTDYILLIDSDDELLENCLEIFNKYLDENDEIVEYRLKCVNSEGQKLDRFKYKDRLNFIDSTWHNMVLRNKNYEEHLSLFKKEYYLSLVSVPEKFIFKEKISNFPMSYFWSKKKGALIRYINDYGRKYHSDSTNSITNHTKTNQAMYNDIVYFKFFLDSNYQYFFLNPMYFIPMYIKLPIASYKLGHGLLNSHFYYEKKPNSIISIILTPICILFYLKMQFIDKKFWR
jgi:glycosyltransferase involved in cell wall biosynthesis